MKKILFVLVIIGLAMICLPCYAGLTYEKGDLKIGLDDVSAGTLYNFGDHEWLATTYTSIVQYKMLNLDAGYIFALENLDEQKKQGAMIGISADILEKDTPLKNTSINVGFGGGYKTKDIDDASSSKIIYGLYTSATIHF